LGTIRTRALGFDTGAVDAQFYGADGSLNLAPLGQEEGQGLGELEEDRPEIARRKTGGHVHVFE